MKKEKDGRIRVLFYNLDSAGVNYFRTLTPATELERIAENDFYVEINNKIDFDDENTIEYLKSFDIIHYHRQLHPNDKKMSLLRKQLKEAGVVLVMDIDDYWYLDKTHPYYLMSLEKELHKKIVFNLREADYVTTTTDHFAYEIRKVTKKDNVFVLHNSINPDWMKQFENNWKPDPEGRVRITYMAGSSHKSDVQQLRTVVNMLNADRELKDKFKIIIAGWDTEGSTTETEFNWDFAEELKELGLWDKKMIRTINQSRGDVDLIYGIPDELREKYRDKVVKVNKRDITSEESVYWEYEKILTNNHNIITNEDYKQWLMNFDRHEKYPNEGNYARRWTQKANRYANVLNETDIVIAPLSNNKFNNMKSNLKQVECWSRRIPVVCSDVIPYNVDGEHMENCILIPDKKNAFKYWKKELKKLILDPDLRNKIGEGLHRDFSEKYHLTNVTKKRAEIYKEIVK